MITFGVTRASVRGHRHARLPSRLRLKSSCACKYACRHKVPKALQASDFCKETGLSCSFSPLSAFTHLLRHEKKSPD